MRRASDSRSLSAYTRLTPAFVLKSLEQRLDNTPDQELAAALAEIGHITRLRLVGRVSEQFPKQTGHLSSHVLDTARGKAAEGVRIELFREGVLQLMRGIILWLLGVPSRRDHRSLSIPRDLRSLLLRHIIRLKAGSACRQFSGRSRPIGC